MPHTLQRPLSHPIVLQGDPPRTIDTFLAAVEFLASNSEATEVEETIDQLIMAARSEDVAAIEDATERLVWLLRRRGCV